MAKEEEEAQRWRDQAVNPSRRTPLTKHADLEPPTSATELIGVSVGAIQEASAVWSTADSPGHFVASIHRTASAHRSVRFENVGFDPNFVEVLPDGELLVVGARAEWRHSGADHNAHIYNPDGELRRTGVLGDGIAHVQTTSTGEIRAGFYDEGVYGNLGWGPPGPPPIGRSGIVRFDSDLAPRWEFPGADPGGHVDDCYALNVTDGAVWACYYYNFPLVEIRSGAVRAFHNTVTGSRAVAVDNDRIAFVRAYGFSDRLVLARIEDRQVRVESVSRLELPDGADLPRRATVTARGSCVHVFVGSEWLRLDPFL
ncbi:MAG: hypothetical protein ACT4QF_07935 [Sporichthyaceae bacterium]